MCICNLRNGVASKVETIRTPKMIAGHHPLVKEVAACHGYARVAMFNEEEKHVYTD